jgi:hypothetical protein
MAEHLLWLIWAGPAVVALLTFAATVAILGSLIELLEREPADQAPLPDYESVGRWLDGRRKYWSRLP